MNMGRPMRNLLAGGIGLLALLPGLARAGKADDTLVVAMARETDFVDRINTDSRESQLFSFLLYDTLLYLDPRTARLEGDLATAWRWRDDKTIEFDLRPGVTFSDGEPFGADDVVYTINFVIDPAHNLHQQEADFGNIASVEKTGPLQVRVHLKAPDPKIEFLFASRLVIWPKGYTSANGPQAHATRPVGTGPYVMQSARPGSEYLLTRNPKGFAGPRPKPAIGRIEVRVIPDPQTQIAELLAGGADFSEDIPADSAAMLAASPGVSVEYGRTTRYYFLSLDAAGRSGDTPLKDLRVRQAVADAIDRAAIASKLVGGGALPLVAQCNSVQALCLQDVPAPRYDPGAARALLASAGLGGGLVLPMIASAELRPVGEAVANDLASVGIKTDFQTFPLPTWRDKFFRGQSAISLLGWGGGGGFDVDNAIHLFYNGSNTDYARDAELSGWAAQAAETTDRAARTALYRRILTRINERAYAVPMYEAGAVYALSAGLDFPAPATGMPDLTWAKWK